MDVKGALLRMPPQVYLADLKPLKVTGGLAFDPKTKSAIRRDIRKPAEKAATIAKEKERYKRAKTKWDPKAYGRLHEDKGGPIMRVTGSATVRHPAGVQILFLLVGPLPSKQDLHR